MIKAAPLIHSRTLYCDFNPRFLARPRNMTDSQALQIRKKILEATKSVDSLKGFRWAVFREDSLCIAGLVCFVEQLALQCQIEEADKKFFLDSKGRPIYAFIGAVMADENVGNDAGIPELPYQQLWDWYTKAMRDVWERQVVDTELTDYEPIETENQSLPDYEKHVIHSKDVYESSEMVDRNLFYKYLQLALKRNSVSYCSNITNFLDAKQSSYTAITTTDNIRRRLEETTAPGATSSSSQKKNITFDEAKRILSKACQSEADMDVCGRGSRYSVSLHIVVDNEEMICSIPLNWINKAGD